MLQGCLSHDTCLLLQLLIFLIDLVQVLLQLTNLLLDLLELVGKRLKLVLLLSVLADDALILLSGM